MPRSRLCGCLSKAAVEAVVLSARASAVLPLSMWPSTPTFTFNRRSAMPLLPPRTPAGFAPPAVSAAVRQVNLPPPPPARPALPFRPQSFRPPGTYGHRLAPRRRRVPQERDLTHVTNYRTALSPGSFHLKPQKARDWDPSIHPFQQALSCLHFRAGSLLMESR
uniref:Uncharacterized protein n=1 Tax=Rousettus aegyptiacus TaxID=9407 RepID=A0A7J8DIS3_ROUAE|nr:hypothetical protein HJG63_008613 [Rousettus aegyptiacus]